jgi:hypothetical protein
MNKVKQNVTNLLECDVMDTFVSDTASVQNGVDESVVTLENDCLSLCALQAELEFWMCDDDNFSYEDWTEGDGNVMK